MPIGIHYVLEIEKRVKEGGDGETLKESRYALSPLIEARLKRTPHG